MSKILVTGGRGFIGKALVKRLKKEGHKVESFDIVDGQDLRNLSQVKQAVKGKDLVYHLAAVADLNWARVHPLETLEINVRGTWNVTHACELAGAKLFYASTCCVYGNQKEHPVNEESLLNPTEIYACSKLAGEYLIKGFHYTYGLEYNLMRFATAYGPGTRPAMGVHVFLRQAIEWEPITIHGDGKQTRTFTYIDDLIDAIVALQESGKINGAWNLTNENEISANEMAKVIKKVSQSDSRIVYISQRVGQTFKESISAEKMREIGWEAKIDFWEGIARTHEWFIKTDQRKNIYKMPK